MKNVSFKELILFENDDVICVNKPPLISSLEDRNNAINMLSLAREYCEGASLCHRLDKETSGVLIIAKHPEAYRHIAIQFEARGIKKVYHAMVDGIADLKLKEISAPIKTMGNGLVKIDRMEGKEAVTIFNTIRAFKRHTLVGCMPYTGRMHQIRIHLSMLGYPITADEAYGGKPFYLSEYKRNFNLKKFTEEESIIKRVALHAYSIGFHLMNDEEVFVEAPYPKDFRTLLKQADKFS